MRGDPPDNLNFFHLIFPSTPHARGSTVLSHAPIASSTVYPACAGIHPGKQTSSPHMESLPRMRGNPPFISTHVRLLEESTPHARGSTSLSASILSTKTVYPACAGIHPKAGTLNLKVDGLPRMRGDPPHSAYCARTDWQSTPHARGSTHCGSKQGRNGVAYPACAGICP